MLTAESNSEQEQSRELSWKDFVSKREVRWCPGCGGYSILNCVQKVFPKLGIPQENFVFVSGIGCSSRFPYYINTFGMHSIHGRAPTFATGIKVANPDLSVWIVTGDGDGLSIGGNHLLHILRRNIDVNVLLFNNRIYGLTKGQYSPTSPIGTKTPTSPQGSIDHPINPVSFALASEASFVARTLASHPKHMTDVLKAAARHKGISFVEIMQDCVIFNEKAWADVSEREVRDDRIVKLENGKPLLFGKNNSMGIRLYGLKPEVVKLGEHCITEDQILIHNESSDDPTYAYMLANLNFPDYPTPIGVFRSVAGKVPYTDLLTEQIKVAYKRRGKGRLQELLYGTSYWRVDENQKITMHSEKKQSLGATTRVKQTMGSEIELQVMYEREKEEKRVSELPVLRILREPLSQALQAQGAPNPPTLNENDSVAAGIEMLKKMKIHRILVVNDDNQMVGTLSDRDILMNVAQKSMDREVTPVKNVMTAKPTTFDETLSIGLALNKFSIGRFRHMPVKKQDGSTGLISVADVLYYMYDQCKEDYDRRAHQD